MKNRPTTALVFMTGRNCEMYVRESLQSLARQDHEDLHILFVDDASDDATGRLARHDLEALFPCRHTFVGNTSVWGKARNAHVHLNQHLDKGDFVAIVDADDRLLADDAISQLAQKHACGYDVVWSNYQTDTGLTGGNAALDVFQPPRSQGWKTSHLFSFRSALFGNIPESMFKTDAGEWISAACDFAIAYPILDQTRRYCHIPRALYGYTATNPRSHHNADPQSAGLNSRRQMEMARIVLSKPPLPCTRWASSDSPLGDAIAAETLQRLRALQQERAAPPAPAPAPRDAATPWEAATAQVLAQKCPALLDLQAARPADRPLDVTLSWQLWRWLGKQRPSAHVLVLGQGEMSAIVHAMVHSQGGSTTSVCSDRDAAMRLYAGLAHAGVDPDTVLHAPAVQMDAFGKRGRLPDLAALGDGTPFDTAIILPGTGADAPDNACVALAAIAHLMHPEDFRVLLWSPQNAGVLTAAHQFWQSLAPELSFSVGAFGGAGLCAHASDSEMVAA